MQVELVDGFRFGGKIGKVDIPDVIANMLRDAGKLKGSKQKVTGMAVDHASRKSRLIADEAQEAKVKAELPAKVAKVKPKEGIAGREDMQANQAKAAEAARVKAIQDQAIQDETVAVPAPVVAPLSQVSPPVAAPAPVIVDPKVQ